VDERSGFWQYPIAVEDRDKTAFQVNGMVYQHTVLAMGHKPSTFHMQKVKHTIFARVIGRGVFIYLDDIFIYSATFAEFMRLLREVFAVLSRHRLRLKASKCEIGMSELCILGHLVSAEGVRMGEDRKSAALAIPFPRSNTELRRYLGYCNYMRRFIPEYATLAQPLSSQVNQPPALWPREEMVVAFDALQTAVGQQLSLAHLDYSLPIFLTTDASTLGVGGSLENRYRDENNNEVRRVVACASHAFTSAEQRWKTLEQEAFAVVWLIMYFRALLWGHPFVIETDHRNLTYIHGGTSPKVMRWAIALQNFVYTLVHVPGVDNVVADTLSRAPRGRDGVAEAVTMEDFSSAPRLFGWA